MHLQTLYSTCDYVEQNGHVLVTTIYNLILLVSLKILGINKKSEDIITFYLIFHVFGHFYCDVIKRKHSCLFGYTKTRSPGIGTVLLWQPPDVHIFHTDPSLIYSVGNYSETSFN